jgi:hypothetical protein
MRVDDVGGIAERAEDPSVVINLVQHAKTHDGTVKAPQVSRENTVEGKPLHATVWPRVIDIHRVAEGVRPFAIMEADRLMSATRSKCGS